jgi:hypothetical protein
VPDYSGLGSLPGVPGLRLCGAPGSDGAIDLPPSLPPQPLGALENTATIGHIGRYALKHQLGAGGLGTVFAAHDPLLSRLIAVKTLHLEVDEDQRASFNALFLNEARAAARLSHPQIVTVFDAGISDDRAYIAMELLKGHDLRQLRDEGWRPTPTQAALIIRRAADALAYAHSKGVVHRDIKPANLFMVGRTQPRVLDFGIARISHQRDLSAGTELSAGSPYYMAPEQARGETVDRRADVFSLGVVLYEMLTGIKPFCGASLAEITEAVLHHNPPLASKVDPRVPPALAAIVARAMHKDVDGRYRSARAFAHDLRQWLDANPACAGSEAGRTGPRRAPWRWLGGLAVAGISLGAVAWYANLAEPAIAAFSPKRADTASLARRTGHQVSPGLLPAAAASAVADVAATAVPANESSSGSTVPGAVPGPTPARMAPVPPAAAKTMEDVAAPVAVVARPRAPPLITSVPTAAAAREAGAKTAAATETASARKVREREARASVPARIAAPVVAAAATGIVAIAIAPWGRVEVDGALAGIAPPLNQLTLSEGRHQIVVRNEDFPAYSVSVNVTPGQPVSLRHSFGP